MSKLSNKAKLILKRIIITLVSLIAALFIISELMNIFSTNSRDNGKQNQAQNCFAYLIELLGRGSKIELKKASNKGFGIYTEEFYLNKVEITNLEISGNDEDISFRYKSPKKVTEFIRLEYFFNNVSIKQKDYIKDKQQDKVTLKFKQTGIKGLTATTRLFANQEPTDSILASSTDCLQVGEFDEGSVLFACKRELTLEEAVEYTEIWDNLPYAPVLLTDSLAIKTGDNENSPVIFLKTATANSQRIGDSAKGYADTISMMLKYLADHHDTTQKILDTGIFGDIKLDIIEIQEYIARNGLKVIGYNAVDTRMCSNSLYDSVIEREQDSISKLVQVNNGNKVFKN